MDPRAGKYLIVELAREEFGIQVLNVQEIMGIRDITAIPHAPAHVKGVINLRSKVIPVVDLRLKFGLPSSEYTQRTCIIVVQGRPGTRVALIGLVVDGVSEVLNLAAADIEDIPEFGNQAPASFLVGIANVKGKIKILMDVEKVLSSQELHGLNNLMQRVK